MRVAEYIDDYDGFYLFSAKKVSSALIERSHVKDVITKKIAVLAMRFYSSFYVLIVLYKWPV